jgi:hypothetical protein
MFHEVTAEVAHQIVPEIYRILRPGGVFNHIDTVTVGYPDQRGASFLTRVPRSIVGKARVWENHRHNIEPWTIDYMLNDFPELLKKTGFVPVERAELKPMGQIPTAVTKPV